MSQKIEIPEILQSKTWLIDKYLSGLQHPLKNSVIKLILVSDYACRHIELITTLLTQEDLNALYTREDCFEAIKTLATVTSLTHYMCELRQFRHVQFLRLLLQEAAGIASTEEIIRSWSDVADAIILHVLKYCQQNLLPQHGTPRDEEGNEVDLYTLAMGKLGGRELNYSSDIDLIFAFTAAGTTDGVECIPNQQFFSKMVQKFVHILQTVTTDGFVFRVDLRLRPNGDSGPLVFSLAAMETYYQEQGRDWERYAMVKARVVAKSVDESPPWYQRLIIPFVYRRYVDFSVIESLRSMKAMIEREVKLNPGLDDIKRGQGGIREVEFIIQNFQLIRGGRIPQLQQKSALSTLEVLKQEKLLPHSDALKQAYLFLRQLENSLQSLNDQQTHSLPDDLIKKTQISLAMGFTTWDDLLIKLQQYQRIICHFFHSVLGKSEDNEDDKRLLANQLSSLWQGHVEHRMAINLLMSLGFENAPHCYQMIHAFRHSPRCRRLSQAARMRLDRFMVILLTELIHFAKTDEVLLQVMHLLENIVGRSAYLALLTENLQALKELLYWLANSPFMTSLLVNQPFLLEVLLDQEKEWRPQSRSQLKEVLQEKLSCCDDIELQEEILRQFKLVNWLMAARAELYGYCDAVRTGKFLSDVAEVIIIQVLSIVCQRHPELNKIKSRFAIIAYGKLGSREMSYSSDLDLVFLHRVQPEEESLVIRLTQKILYGLTMRSQSGILYSVDTRLRPSGAAGLLVSHLASFIAYQKNQAWTWEHQALVKARIVCGNSLMKQAFLQLKKTVLREERDKRAIQKEVLNMRAKIELHQESDHLKYAHGGLLDLEFLVQFLVLSYGNSNLARYTHTLSQIRQLLAVGALTENQAFLLKKAYNHYHHLLHQNIIKPGVVTGESMQHQVLAVCEAIYNLDS